MGWTLAILAVLALAAYLALQFAIARNGPAVLDAVDRLSGGSRGAQLIQQASYGPSSAQKLAVYGPAEPAGKARPVLIFSHGGSWRSGDPGDYGFLARGLVPEGFVVVLAGYRLHPEARFPAMLEDTAAAVSWTRENIARHGGDPDRVFLAGHSAGAYNVVMTALDRQWLGRAGVPDGAIAGVIGLAGPYDFYPFDSDSTRASFGEAPGPARTTQPIAFARKDAPPMLLMTGEQDTTVKPRNTRALAERLTALGAPVETRFFAEFDHNAILLRTAGPWRRDSRVIDAIRDFALPIASSQAKTAKTSVPVQGETR